MTYDCDGFRVSSTNGLGTTFTVKDLGTALQIAGGPGHDTLIAQCAGTPAASTSRQARRINISGRSFR